MAHQIGGHRPHSCPVLHRGLDARRELALILRSTPATDLRLHLMLYDFHLLPGKIMHLAALRAHHLTATKIRPAEVTSFWLVDTEALRLLFEA